MSYLADFKRMTGQTELPRLDEEVLTERRKART